MGRHRTRYPAEFRAHMVELVKAGHTPEELAREFEATEQTITNWGAQANRDASARHDGLTTAERQEPTRLRRENRQLTMEKDILSQAAAWFARETGAVLPKGGTNSRERTAPGRPLPRWHGCWRSRPTTTMRGWCASHRNGRAAMRC